METFIGIMIPFLGTALGAACVFFMKKFLGDLVQRALAGFAAGVMVAASIWSLLIPAIEQSEDMGKLSFLPAFIGFWVGVLFLLLLDRLIPHLHVGSNQVSAFSTIRVPSANSRLKCLPEGTYIFNIFAFCSIIFFPSADCSATFECLSIFILASPPRFETAESPTSSCTCSLQTDMPM